MQQEQPPNSGSLAALASSVHSHAASEASDPSSPDSSTASLRTVFSPYQHSWILVPEALPEQDDEAHEHSHTESPTSSPSAAASSTASDVELLPQFAAPAAPPASPTGRASPPPGVTGAPPTAVSGPPSGRGTPLASPHRLSESLLGESGETVAQLAVSELLGGSQCLAPSARGPSPLARSLLSTSTRSSRGSSLASSEPGSPTKPAAATHEPRKSKKRKEAPPTSETDSLIIADLSGWGRPLAVVAALVFSHAAVLLVGIAIGRAQPSARADSSTATPQLVRHFSSGSTGVHARYVDRMC